VVTAKSRDTLPKFHPNPTENEQEIDDAKSSWKDACLCSSALCFFRISPVAGGVRGAAEFLRTRVHAIEFGMSSFFTIEVQELSRFSNAYSLDVKWYTSIKDIKDQVGVVYIIAHLFIILSPSTDLIVSSPSLLLN
jgi:hypothetical protein